MTPEPSRQPRRLRVLQVLHGLARAGAEQLVYELATANRAVLATAVACLDHQGPLADLLRAEGCPIYFTGRREGLDLPQAARLARAIGHFRPHVVHCHQYTPWLYGSLGCILSGRGRLLFTEHGRHFPDIVTPRRRAFNRFLARFTPRMTAVCEFTRQRLIEREGLPPGRIEVVYNGVEPARFEGAPSRRDVRRRLGLDEQALIVVQVGTFRGVKDHATALRAFARLAAQDAAALLVLVGSGPDLEARQAQARELGLEQRVRFLGQRGDIPDILPAADVMLMTSLSEAHSVSLLEGMACGLPIVATRVGGIPETVEDGVSGLLTPSQDDQALAGALRTLLADPALRERMGQAGRNRVQRLFLRNRMHERYMQIYRELAWGAGDE